MQRELLFETHADQVKMILVALKIIKNADVNKRQPNDPLGIPQAIYGERFSSHPLALRVWDNHAI